MRNSKLTLSLALGLASLASCDSAKNSTTQSNQSIATQQQQLQQLNELTSRTGVFDLKFQSVSDVNLYSLQTPPPPSSGGGNGNPGPAPSPTAVPLSASGSSNTSGTSGTSGNSGSLPSLSTIMVQVSGRADFYPGGPIPAGSASPMFILDLSVNAIFAEAIPNGSQCLTDAQNALIHGAGFEIIGAGTLVQLPCPVTTNAGTCLEPVAIANGGTSSSATANAVSMLVDPTVTEPNPAPLPPWRFPYVGVNFQSLESCLVLPIIVKDPLPTPTPTPTPVKDPLPTPVAAK